MHLAANVHTVEDQPVLAHNVNFAAHELPLQLVEEAEMHGSIRAVLRGGVPHQIADLALDGSQHSDGESQRPDSWLASSSRP